MRRVKFESFGLMKEGLFHQWIRDANGEPCAIIERGDGSVEVCQAQLVKFLFRTCAGDDTGSEYAD